MVTDKHVTFARAVVALARQHGMTNLDMSYRLSFTAHDEVGVEQYQTVRMQWGEGRHGDTSKIILQTDSRTEVPEKVK